MTSEGTIQLAEKLDKKGWSQGRLRKEMMAIGVKVPEGQVCRWLKGREPSAQQMEAIKKLLRIRMESWARPAAARAA